MQQDPNTGNSHVAIQLSMAKVTRNLSYHWETHGTSCCRPQHALFARYSPSNYRVTLKLGVGSLKVIGSGTNHLDAYLKTLVINNSKNNNKKNATKCPQSCLCYVTQLKINTIWQTVMKFPHEHYTTNAPTVHHFTLPTVHLITLLASQYAVSYWEALEQFGWMHMLTLETIEINKWKSSYELINQQQTKTIS